MNRKIRRMAICILLLCLSLCMFGCAEKKPSESTELYILAAASMTDALTEIKTQYEKKEPEVELLFQFHSSGTLQKQIEQGVPADVFLSASTRQMDELEREGLIKEKSVQNLLKNRLVLIKPKNSDLDISSFEEAASDKVSMIALGNPDVPAAQYAEKLYTRLGLWEEVQKKANFAFHVRQVLDWVATDNADCGIVYATDAKIEKNVTVVCEAPEDLCGEIVYPAGIVEYGEHIKESEAFVDYLKTDEAKEIFEKYGFIAE